MTDFCEELHHQFSQLHHFHFPFIATQIPLNGIYVVFEDGEVAHGTDRIVRVGTHTGNNQLRSRLEQHFMRENKDRSMFRKNIGRALLNRDGDPFLEQWEIDLTTRKAKQIYGSSIDIEKQKQVEHRVTAYIQTRFHFIIIEILNKVDRLMLESRIISTVSLCHDCRPSANWLGLHSPKRKIRESGLWIVNELFKQPLDKREFDILLQRLNHL